MHREDLSNYSHYFTSMISQFASHNVSEANSASQSTFNNININHTKKSFNSFSFDIKDQINSSMDLSLIDKLISYSDPNNDQLEGWEFSENICIVELNYLVNNSRYKISAKLVRFSPVSTSLMRAITSIKFSPSCRFALLGYGVRNNGIVEDHDNPNVACEIFNLYDMRSYYTVSDTIDEINVALFHNIPGNGIIYGTKRGKVKSFNTHR